MEKNRVKLDDDSDEEEEEGKEGQENANSASNHTPAVTTPCTTTEEKKPQLTQEELEAKQGIPYYSENQMRGCMLQANYKTVMCISVAFWVF